MDESLGVDAGLWQPEDGVEEKEQVGPRSQRMVKKKGESRWFKLSVF